MNKGTKNEIRKNVATGFFNHYAQNDLPDHVNDAETDTFIA